MSPTYYSGVIPSMSTKDRTGKTNFETQPMGYTSNQCTSPIIRHVSEPFANGQLCRVDARPELTGTRQQSYRGIKDLIINGIVFTIPMHIRP